MAKRSKPEPDEEPEDRQESDDLRPSDRDHRPQTISAERLCEITSLTDRRHRQLAGQGYFPPPIRGLYQMERTLAGIIKYQREQLSKRNDELRVEQQSLARAKRQLAEEELAEFRGEYIMKSEIGPAIRNIAISQRAALLRKYEQELAPKLHGKSTVEILRMIQDANNEICNTFANSTAKWAATPL